MAVTKIIACSDIHIPSFNGIDDKKEVLVNFINQCKNIVKKEGKNNVRIVVAGAWYNNKNARTR